MLSSVWPGVRIAVSVAAPMRDLMPICDGGEWKPRTVLSRQEESGPGLLGQLARTRQVVRVDVGFKHPSNSTAMLLGEAHVDLRPDRGIDHCRFILRNDEVREAALPGSPNLNDACRRVSQRHMAVFQAMLQAFMPPASESTSMPRSVRKSAAFSLMRPALHTVTTGRSGGRTASCSRPGSPLRRAS